ncbi:primosomal protein DnaI [Brevibacillus laterosporus]|uniref:primosomal protein DnaI n=1 Tax=Brevibacillus laterosporus TaxID=1465 RepID=UPI001EF355E6|nr:primosomal protein DnaI [Brevibacillus laterosporus]MCG7318282.1 primosomal protein DnaI [Brevibacillus laterosporus]
MEALRQFMEDIAKRAPRHILSPDEQLDKMMRSSLYLKSFQQKHPELTRDDLFRSLSTVYKAVQEHYYCEKCPGLSNCPNLVKGHFNQLQLQSNQIVSVLTPCNKQLAHEDNERARKRIRSYYVSQETLEACFERMDVDSSNQEAIDKALEFCDEMRDNKKQAARGLYVHGGFGVGKSYLMAAIARELSESNISSLMVYVPDFIREVKESLSDQSYVGKLELLKEIPVLILDDLGAENVTPWIRDEVIGVILNQRINNHLPTLFASNYSLEELEEHFAISNGSRIEVTKARRILERIRHYVEVVEIEGMNRRKR